MKQDTVFSKIYSRNTANEEEKANGEAPMWRGLFDNSRIHVLGKILIWKMKVVPKCLFFISYQIEKFRRICEYSNNRWYYRVETFADYSPFVFA